MLWLFLLFILTLLWCASITGPVGDEYLLSSLLMNSCDVTVWTHIFQSVFKMLCNSLKIRIFLQCFNKMFLVLFPLQSNPKSPTWTTSRPRSSMSRWRWPVRRLETPRPPSPGALPAKPSLKESRYWSLPPPRSLRPSLDLFTSSWRCHSVSKAFFYILGCYRRWLQCLSTFQCIFRKHSCKASVFQFSLIERTWWVCPCEGS